MPLPVALAVRVRPRLELSGSAPHCTSLGFAARLSLVACRFAFTWLLGSQIRYSRNLFARRVSRVKLGVVHGPACGDCA
jgi:hypothetical protein